MIPRFHLERPSDLDAALASYASSRGDTAYVAGGTELLQVMKMGLAEFETLIDLKGVRELGGIGLESDGTLRIGATVTHREIERSAIVADALPVLVKLEAGLANLRVRNCGTLGGNIAFAEPHSDPATLLLVCDARVELASLRGRRQIPIADFTLGPLFTARDEDEVLVAIRIPHRGHGVGIAYAKFKFFERPAVSVAVRLRVEDGRVGAADVAVGSATEVPGMVPAAAAPLVGVSPAEIDEALARSVVAMDALDAVDDHNGSADYKRHLAAVLLRRVTHAALDEAIARV